jgi:hypothetical protein
VESEEYVGSIQLHYGTQQSGLGGIASQEWKDNPANTGFGNYQTNNRHRANSSCGDDTQYTSYDNLSVDRPYVSGPNNNTQSNQGLWWFGRDGSGNPIVDSGDGYYPWGQVYAHTGGAPEQVVWSVSGSGASAVTLSCMSGCTSPQVNGQGHSRSAGDIQIGFTVGGLTATPLPWTANYPTHLQSTKAPTTVINNVAPYGLLGYTTTFEYVVRDIANNGLPTMSTNETLKNPWQLSGSTWTPVTSQGFPGTQYPWYQGYFMQDKVSYFATASDPNPSPPAYVPTSDPRYGEPVQSWTQEWRFGTASIGFGTFLQTGTLKRNVSFATLAAQPVPVP